MKKFEVAYRYAKALFALKAGAEEREARATQLLEMASLMKRLPLFRRFLKNPQIKSENKKNLLETIIEDAPLVNFLLMLLSRGKLELLPEIAAKYQSLKRMASKMGVAWLVTAKTVDAEIKTQLKERLERAYAKPFILYEKIKPEIIGGAILIVDNKLIDFSIKGRLEAMKKSLLRSV
jgi:F-type H+-transporting ATPase subunit delta